MKPINFKQQNIYLTKPVNMTEAECGNLPSYNDGTDTISLWNGNFKERLKFLFTGQIWMGVHSGKTQPPVYLTLESPFKKPDLPKGVKG